MEVITLNKALLRSTTLLIWLGILLVGCSQNNSANEGQAELSELAMEGEKIIKTSCISCHGRDLKGDMGPSLYGLTMTDEELKDILIKGKGAMPPATANGKEEEVIAYLKTLQ